MNAYLRLKGREQGDIAGPITESGLEGTILVHSFDHEATTPHDPATGQSNGKRQHQPLVILKAIDKSSPLLWKAFANGEAFATWELHIWEPGATPAQPGKLIYTITLVNAHVTSIHTSMESSGVARTNAMAAPTPTAPEEDVSFTYDSIRWNWTDGGVTATDDW